MRSAVTAGVLLAACLTACTEGGSSPSTPGASVGPGQHEYTVGGENMERTLHGCRDEPACTPDRVIFDLLSNSSRRVRAGDVIAFHAPSGWADARGDVLISRVIAVGGETVKGDADGRVMMSHDGPSGPFQTLDEPYVLIEHSAQGNVIPFGPVTVPHGRVWVMGDHRTDSADSRFHRGPHGSFATNGRRCHTVASTVSIADVIGIGLWVVAPDGQVHALH